MRFSERELRSLPGVVELLDQAHGLQAIRNEHIRLASWRRLVHEADEVIRASVLSMQLGPAAIEGAQKAFRFNSCVLADLFFRIPLDELKSWEV